MTPRDEFRALPLLALARVRRRRDGAERLPQPEHDSRQRPAEPYSDGQVMPLPDGRTWGSTAGVDAAKGRDDIWAIDRCGSNTCVGSHAIRCCTTTPPAS